MPRMYAARHILILVSVVGVSPAFAADRPITFVDAPPAVSIVPHSGLFLGVGASANSVNFNNQNVYGRGTSDTPADYNAFGVLQPPIVGTAAGGTGLTLSNSSALAPVIQGGYFTHINDTPWMGGVKMSYTYLGISSSNNDLLIPQSGGFLQGGVYTPFTGNYVVQSYRQTVNSQFSLIPFLGHSFEKSFVYLGAGPTLAQTRTQIERITGFADVVGVPTSITGIGQGSNYSFSQWLWGVSATVGATYFLDRNWFVDVNYVASITQSKTSNWGGPWSDTPSSGSTRTGTNMGTSSGGVVTQQGNRTWNSAALVSRILRFE